MKIDRLLALIIIMTVIMLSTILQVNLKSVDFYSEQIAAIIALVIMLLAYAKSKIAGNLFLFIFLLLHTFCLINIFLYKNSISFYINKNSLSISSIDFDIRIIPFFIIYLIFNKSVIAQIWKKIGI